MAAEQSQHKSFSSTWQMPWKETEEQLLQNCPTCDLACGRSCGLLIGMHGLIHPIL